MSKRIIVKDIKQKVEQYCKLKRTFKVRESVNYAEITTEHNQKIISNKNGKFGEGLFLFAMVFIGFIQLRWFQLLLHGLFISLLWLQWIHWFRRFALLSIRYPSIFHQTMLRHSVSWPPFRQSCSARHVIVTDHLLQRLDVLMNTFSCQHSFLAPPICVITTATV